MTNPTPCPRRGEHDAHAWNEAVGTGAVSRWCPGRARPAWAYAPENLPAAREAGYDDPAVPSEPGASAVWTVDYGPHDATLGPCGCVDYHLADCPTRTGGGDGSDAWAWAEARARRDDDGWWDQ